MSGPVSAITKPRRVEKREVLPRTTVGLRSMSVFRRISFTSFGTISCSGRCLSNTEERSVVFARVFEVFRSRSCTSRAKGNCASYLGLLGLAPRQIRANLEIPCLFICNTSKNERQSYFPSKCYFEVFYFVCFFSAESALSYSSTLKRWVA